MGGDGGFVTSRSLLVKNKKLQSTEIDPTALLVDKLTHCALTGLPLSRPVVVCELGNLYNKDAVITHLLSKQDVPAFRHLRGLNDLTSAAVVFQSDRSSEHKPRVSAVVTNSASVDKSMIGVLDGPAVDLLVCPLTDVKADGKHPFIAMRGCGCVLALKSYTELNRQGSDVCFVCDRQLDSKYRRNRHTEDKAGDADKDGDYLETGETAYITLVGNVETVDVLRQVMMAKRVKAIAKKEKEKKEKKEKKDKKHKGEGQDDSERSSKKTKLNTDGLLRIPTAPKDANNNMVELDSTASAILKEVEANLKNLKEKSTVFKEMFHNKK